jgi:hypothetical protein
MGKFWTEDEMDKLIEVYSQYPNRELAIMFSRTVQAIDKKAADLLIHKNKDYIKRANTIKGNKRWGSWNLDEDRYLFDHLEEPYKNIAENLNRTIESVSHRVRKMNWTWLKYKKRDRTEDWNWIKQIKGR